VKLSNTAREEGAEKVLHERGAIFSASARQGYAVRKTRNDEMDHRKASASDVQFERAFAILPIARGKIKFRISETYA
jgi:hypothetical protein